LARRHEQRGLLFHFIGKQFVNPVFPKLYLQASLRGTHQALFTNTSKENDEAFYLMLIDYIAWGKTLSCGLGLDLQSLLSVIDDLAEYHAFQLSC
jgi:hypothetical protein